MVDVPGGYFGRALVVDVTDGSAEELALEGKTLRRYVGGVGLGTYLMHRLAPRGVDALAPEAPLAFVFSPLVGTPLTTSAKFAVVAKSPLTDRLNDALASSHFAIAGKLSGHDALVVTGARDAPSVLLVDGSGARLQDAADLWGLPAADAEARLRERLGPAWRIAAIGPAGERLVRYATVVARRASRRARRAGCRTGLKVHQGRRGAGGDEVRDRRPQARPCGRPRPARALFRARHREVPRARHPRQPARVQRDLDPADAQLPGCHVRRGAAAGRRGPRRGARRGAKLVRVVLDRLRAHLRHQGRRAGARRVRERLRAGASCGVSDPDAVLAASARCDALGMDTISAGGTIAWAMECAEQGLIDAPWLRFGDAGALLRALDEIGARRALGDLLAEGSRRASAEVGGEAESLAVHVKGLELPGYEPRTLQAMALGMAVNPRGADHNRSGAYEADLAGGHDRLAGGAAHAAAAIVTEDRAAIMDSLILCKFLRGVFADPFSEWAGLLGAVTGWDVDGAELERTAVRIVLAKRLFNLREGWTCEEDWLPERFLTEALELDSGRIAALTPEQLRAMIAAYYEGRGLDGDGKPGADRLEGLSLDVLVH